MDYSDNSVEKLNARLQSVQKELEALKIKLKDATVVKEKLGFELTERKKELKCHNLLSQIFSLSGLSQKQVFHEILDAIPASWQFPEITQVCIKINDDIFQTPGYHTSDNELSVPILSGETQIGEIIVAYPERISKEGENLFLPEEKDLLNTIAERIGNYLQKSKIEKIAIENELMYKSFIDASPDSMTITDLEGNILFTSPQVNLIFGYSVETNFLHRNIFEFIDAKYHEKAKNAILEMFNGIFTGAEEYLGIKSDGSRFFIEVNGDFIRDADENPTKIIFVTRDISERKKMENTLVESERRLKTMMGNLPGIAYRCLNDKDWTMQFMSERCKELTGFSSDIFTGKNQKPYNDIIHPDDRNYVADKIEEGVRQNKSYELEYRIISATGETKYVWEKGQGILENGKLLFLEGLIIDITRRKELNFQLEQNEKKYRYLIESINDVLYEIKGDGTFVYVNPVCERIFGYKPEELVGTKLLDYVCQPDLPLILKAFKNHLNKNYSHLDYRIYNKSGKIRWVRSSTTPIFENGKLVGGTGVLRDITEVKSAELELKGNKERFEQIAEQSHTVIWEVDKNGLFTYVSPMAEKVLGYKPKELVGKIHYYDLHPEKNREDFIRVTQQVFAKKQHFKDLPNPIVTKGGTVIIVSTNGIPILDENNNLLGYRGADNDISEKLKAEEELKLFKRTSDIANYGYVIISEKQEIIYVNEALARMYGRSIDELLGEKDYYFFHNDSHKEDYDKMVEELFREGSISAAESIHLKADGTEFPVLINASLIKDENNIPKYLAATITDISDLKEAQEKVKRSEEKYRGIFENIQDTYYEATLEGIITEISPSIEIISHGQYKREELIGESVVQMYANPEERGVFYNVILKSGRITDFEIALLNRDGKTIPVSITAALQFDEKGNPVKIIGIIRDITERKKASEELRQSEERYKSIFNKSQSVMLIVDPETGKITDANTAACNFYGWPHDELLKMTIWQINTLNKNEVIKKLNAAVNEENKHFYFKHKLSNGEIRDVEIFTSPIVVSGKVFNYEIIYDITDRKKAEEALVRSEKNLNEAQKIAGMGSWEFDLESKAYHWSENLYRVMGFEPYEMEFNEDDILKLVFPEDRHYFGKFLPEILKTKKQIDFEFRIKKANENYIWVRTIVSPVIVNNTIVGLKGINIDITEQKNADEEITNINHRLKAILEALPDLLFVINSDGRYLDFIAKKDVELAIPREQIIGSGITEVFPAAQAKQVIDKIKECLKTKELVILDYTIQINGQSFYYEARVTPFTNDSVVVLTHDITEKKLNDLTIAKLSMAVQQSTAITIITGLNGDIEYVNPAFEKVTGYTSDEVLGKNPRFLKSGKTEKAFYKKMWNTILEGKNWRGEWMNRKKVGNCIGKMLPFLP